MRTFPLILFVTLFCSVSSAAIRDDEMMREALKDCDKNQLAINFCALHAFEVVDEKLNKVYVEVLAKMVTPKAKDRLRQAQRAWISFRDKDCLVVVGPPERGGSMYQGLWWNCVEQRTRARLAELEELSRLLRCDEQPCPPSE
jgi:uncharacterized protein YecT (DUF1311 family)